MSNKYVLLVEDNPDDVELTKMAFKKGQISNKLIVAEDGREALDFLFCRGNGADRIPSGNPAVVLLDLKLPCVSGLDILKEIRSDKNTSQIPVVVLTSSSEEKDQTDSFRLEANDFIRKPTSYSHFVEIIQKIKAKWLD
jgi:two-component system response regulator